MEPCMGWCTGCCRGLPAETAHAAGFWLAALDQVARDVLADAGASSPFLGYRPGFAGDSRSPR